MSTEGTAGATTPETGFDFSKDLAALEAFGVAFGELELTGLGTAKLLLSIPNGNYSGTVKLGRDLKYEVGIDANGKFFANVSAT